MPIAQRCGSTTQTLNWAFRSSFKRFDVTTPSRANVACCSASVATTTDVIFDRVDCSPWEPGAFSLHFMRLVARSPIAKVRFHDLQHYARSAIALAAGIDLKAISAALGHSTIAVTAKTPYLHVVDLRSASNTRSGSTTPSRRPSATRSFEAPGPQRAQCSRCLAA